VKDQYDYIIVGAGSSGCALANRLSADPSNSVLLIEAGPDDKDQPMVHMPRGIGVVLNPGSKIIWDYMVKTGGNGPEERWPRGRLLGGSSSINGMVYMRGAPLDYDGWEKLGCVGWGWKDVGRKFKELENHDQGETEWRGVGGPLNVTTHKKGEPFFDAIIQAGEQMGVPRTNDVNDVKSVKDGGIGYQANTTWRGQRFSAAKAFIYEARNRPNLDVVTDTEVHKIVFEGKRAAGVLTQQAGVQKTVGAKREIILCCGAIETPKLLQLSGVGPADLLQPLGIDVVVDAPEVGRNLREHRHVDIQLKVKGGSQNKDVTGWRVILSALRYFLTKKGPMTHAAHEVGGFAKTDPSLEHADLQFGLISVMSVGDDQTKKVGVATYPGVTFLAYFTRPESQGTVRITSADPKAAPDINANQMSAEIDRKKLVAVFHWLRKLAAQPALKNWVIEEVSPAGKVQTDDDILANFLTLGGTCWHTCGTARMGVDEAAVLDPRLRVRGVEGLRVADTSIMPTIVSGNTNAPAMMVGLRAADFILEDKAA
jgi:choline dehydrogenase